MGRVALRDDRESKGRREEDGSSGVIPSRDRDMKEEEGEDMRGSISPHRENVRRRGDMEDGREEANCVPHHC